MAFDGWEVKRIGAEIIFNKSKRVDIDSAIQKESNLNENEFLKQQFTEIKTQNLPIDSTIIPFLDNRIIEIEKCLSVKASLSAIFLIGSSLEGILLGLALKYPAAFNRAKSAPKDNTSGKVRNIHDRTLRNFIDVSHELGILKEDVKKFSHILRDFRNYIHPYEQMSHNFHPDENTCKICFQVLKAALFQIESNSVMLST